MAVSGEEGGMRIFWWRFNKRKDAVRGMVAMLLRTRYYWATCHISTLDRLRSHTVLIAIGTSINDRNAILSSIRAPRRGDLVYIGLETERRTDKGFAFIFNSSSTLPLECERSYHMAFAA